MELGAIRQLSYESKGKSLVGEEVVVWRRVEIYGDVESGVGGHVVARGVARNTHCNSRWC